MKTAAAAASDVAIDAPTTVRAWAVSRLVDAARRAGKPDVAAETELAKLKALIAHEGRPPTVPLVVEKSAEPPRCGQGPSRLGRAIHRCPVRAMRSRRCRLRCA